MSHPNRYLFQISRVVEQAYRRMDIQQGPVRTHCRMFMDFKNVFLYYLDSCLVTLMYERVLLYTIFIRSNLSCKFLMYPVLKIMHMLNFLDTFSMGVTPYLSQRRSILQAGIHANTISMQ